MNAQYLFLVPGALFVAFFVVVLASGALLGLARLGLQALRAVGTTQDAKAQAPSTQLVLRLAPPDEAVESDSFGGAVPVYVRG
jgi:hypothetical protein